MATFKICFVIAMLATSGFGAVAGAISNKEFEDTDQNIRMSAMLFVGATTPR